LTFKPPFTAGSYNRLVGMQLALLPELRQAVISYWDGPRPETSLPPATLFLITPAQLSWRQKLLLTLPERLRGQAYNGVSERAGLTYLWGIQKKLKQLRPKLVICYDNYKFGLLLRQQIDWPCRLILSQHGLSYFLTSAEATRVYSLRSFDAVWALTAASYRFDRQRISAYEAVVKVLPNWINTEQFKPLSEPQRQAMRAQWGLPADKLVVLLLSRLVPKKGAHAILQAWPKILARVPNAQLWIVGGGEEWYVRYLNNMAQALGCSASVHLQGAVHPDKVPGCYQAADLYLFPTLFEGEAFALSLLEGMACGLPSIASDCAIFRELYSSNGVVLVPDPNLEEAFVEPVVTLLQDPAQRACLGAKARAFVQEHFQQEKVLPLIRDFYEQQLKLVGGQR
jgi:glycosyltransferase involved in cell wall biosynthesis